MMSPAVPVRATSSRRSRRILAALATSWALAMPAAHAQVAAGVDAGPSAPAATVATAGRLPVTRGAAIQATADATAAAGPAYVAGISANGRYFVDQYGAPFLVRGDSPWSILTRLSPAQAETWFADRQRHGYNAAIVSLIGAVANGAPADDGATYDGLRPFVGHDVLAWNEAYFQRAHDVVAAAAAHGITVFLYPIDGWTYGHSFVPGSADRCGAFGDRVAQRFRDLPNIVWMTGGDYAPGNRDDVNVRDSDRCLDAMRAGIRATDRRPFSIQLGAQQELSTDDAFWAPRVDWDFVYSYSPTYRDTLRAYARTPVRPALLGESNYEGENNTGGKPTTNQTLRRQILWAVTSGAAGDFAGSQDWKFDPGWEGRLDTAAVAQIALVRDLVAKSPWWDLVPDRALVTSGRGTPLPQDQEADVLDSDYATAARTADGRFAAVYVPSGRTIGIDRRRLAAGTQPQWVDPSSGAVRPAVAVRGRFTTPGPNGAGDGDWLLVFGTTPF